MAKRHILTTEKQHKGQYFTTNIDHMIAGLGIDFTDRIVVDPFAGDWDLLKCAEKGGAKEVIGYDLQPTNDLTIQNDSLMNPVDYSGKLLFSNPPYLCANKCRPGGKLPYLKWQQNDYYKCHLASLYPSCDEAILILPANFLSESNAKARTMLFSNYRIINAKYWTIPIFQDTNSTICILHIKREKITKQEFSCLLNNSNTVHMELEQKYGWLFGKDFFDHIEGVEPIAHKCDVTTAPPNTNIVVGILDNGKFGTGYHLNYDNPTIPKKSVFTTFPIRTDFDLSREDEIRVVDIANTKLNEFREKYYSMFMANYLGPNQKILSVLWARKLLSRIILDTKKAYCFLDKFNKK